MWKFIILAIFVITVLVCISSYIKSNKKYRKSKKKFNKSNKKHTFTPITPPYIFDDNKCETEKSNLDSIPVDEDTDEMIKTYETLISSSSSISPTIKKELNISFTQYKSKYDFLLHKSEWITCREKILERDNYKCQWCGSENNLQIHHKYYCKLPNNKLVNPWEYKEDCFMTLCKQCHEKLHQKYKNKVYYRSYGEQTEVLRYINKLNKQ